MRRKSEGQRVSMRRHFSAGAPCFWKSANVRWPNGNRPQELWGREAPQHPRSGEFTSALRDPFYTANTLT